MNKNELGIIPKDLTSVYQRCIIIIERGKEVRKYVLQNVSYCFLSFNFKMLLIPQVNTGLSGYSR